MVYEVEMWAFCNGAVRKVDVPLVDMKSIDDSQKDSLTLEAIFYWGQNDFQPQDMPSVSVGDIAQLAPNSRWLCCSLGWRKLDADEYIEYINMDKTDRILSMLVHQMP